MLAERWEDSDEVRAEALCNDGTGNLTALFFSEQLDDIARAKAICAECPVREACFENALARREPVGSPQPLQRYGPGPPLTHSDDASGANRAPVRGDP